MFEYHTVGMFHGSIEFSELFQGRRASAADSASRQPSDQLIGGRVGRQAVSPDEQAVRLTRGPSVLPVRSRDSVPVPPVQREAEGKPADLSDPFRHWVSQFFGTGADQAGAQTTAGGFSTSSSRSASGLLCLFGELAGRWRGPSHAHLSGQLPKTGSLPGIVPAAHRVYLCRMPPFCLSRGLVCSAAAHRRTVCSLSPPQRSPPVA